MRHLLKPAIAFVVLYLLAVCTPYGQSVENRFGGYASDTWVSHIQYSVGPPPLRFENLTFVAGVALIVLVAVLRKQWRLAVAGIFVPVATAASTYLLNRLILPRPDISNAPAGLTEVSFPSGHVAVTVGVAAGAILVSTPRARPYVAAAGLFWLAFVAAAVQNLGWHRPSDAIGATLLACISYLVASHWLPKATQSTHNLGLLPGLVISTAGAILGAGRTDYFPEAVGTAIVGLLCALILWSTFAQGLRTGLIAVLVLAIVSTIGVDYWRKHSAVTVDSSQSEPAVITGPGTAGKGVTVGKPGATTNIDFYLGFNCGRCAEFEQASDSTLDSMLENGTATITYWPVVAPEADQRLPNLFAVAAANGKAHGFLHAFYSDFEKAWTDKQLIELGEKLGLPRGKVTAALTTNSYQDWFGTLDQTTIDREITDLPAVLVNDRKLLGDEVTLANLKSAIG
ncbi:thioredoxin domain-containing protein [Kribbella sp. NPDC056861]|uniref:thioredoxin domain-containing protein n=1 Tax=Kribbella sp. NPDC056861 TaxID=3154857 RepID=UPI00342B63E2